MDLLVHYTHNFVFVMEVEFEAFGNAGGWAAGSWRASRIRTFIYFVAGRYREAKIINLGTC